MKKPRRDAWQAKAERLGGGRVPDDRRDLTQGQRAMIAARLQSYTLYDFGEVAKAERGNAFRS